jgi:enoyl-CoA hydratase/carnithine racemase
MNDRVKIEIVDGVADVRLNRADKMNALDPAMFEGISTACERLTSESSLRAVVLSGEGRAFCAGLDMNSFSAMASGQAYRDLAARSHGICNLAQYAAYGWRDLPVPVIAAVHGTAFGGGFQIASGADLRFVEAGTRLSIMEIKWGLVPDMAGTVLWRGLVRDDILREFVYTGRIFSGEEAVHFGFATRVCADPRAEALAFARDIAGRSPDAIRAAKRLLNTSPSADAADRLMAESMEQSRLIGSLNQVEAVLANIEKRKPLFADVS